MSANKEGIKGVAVGRIDIYRMAPADLHVKDGWNARVVNFNRADPEDLGLAQSIAEVGVKQPLTVYWENGKAYISDGHRRHGAAIYAIEHLGAEIKSVPVQTEERYSSEADRVFSQIVRNSGKPLSPIEQAKVFKRLIDLGWSEKDIAEKSGLNRAWVVELLELNAAPQAVTSLVRSGKVSATLAITTLRKNKGDGEKAATELSEAVEAAQEQGKTRATAKHLGERKPSLKAELKDMFSETPIREQGGDDLIGGSAYLITLTPDQYARLRYLVGF